MKRFVKHLFGILVFLAGTGACSALAYYLTALLYFGIDKEPHDLIKYLINFFLSFLLIFGCFYIIGKLARAKHVDQFKLLIDAIKKIAKGDFNVDLKEVSKDKGPWTVLADSISDMAVELNQMEQMRQEFISNVSHEIQSPLTSISGFTKVLRQEHLTHEERMHYLGIIETESVRLSRLSENLLKLTSLESEHPPFDPKPYRLDRQLRDIVLACEPQWLEKGIEMEIDLQEASIVADRDLMSQVWINLIHNSIKFTPSGGTIAIEMLRQEDKTLVRISDTGIGIAEEDQLHMFERFYKADKSRNRSEGGSGLGLSIVKKIVEMHRGDLSVQSELGAGTTITVSI
ncbi:Adaptive-response sensory-kinase SasA [Paenibacillus sp. CECT 9249]|uniref:sensor histidine kinase n=1 Tax=Paenibacillus sp. CECT 9249 TaxID=2845385 RepID=UPI001E3036A4|nr:HAMP domain-containing sensor histidine kinase [Paenibacillus sp. CECT 9249]CAH0118223.1 Adaptive-response sensory-kinase SasA [Paenibacillus sp. CECT 9249]